MRLLLLKAELFSILFLIPYKVFLFKNKKFFEENNIEF